MAEIINGKELAKNIKQSLKQEVDKLKEDGIIPKLAVILVGNDEASKVYVRNKSKACNKTGIEYEEYILEETTQMDELLSLIEKLNKRADISGILLQSPLPKHLDINVAFRAIDPSKDVDGFHPMNVGKLVLGQDTFVACTPYGVMRMLEAYNINIEGKNAVIIGRSNIVGKPLVQCLLSKNATVTVCHSRTKNIEEITKKADLIVAALGKANFVKEDMVKEGCVVIDVGINRLENGKLVGDVDFEQVSKKASYITPVPGGVGPMTIAMLMENVVKAAKHQNI
ncbi:MAG TPA: bifunctional methylenetetrahydrofolate dehydrogenase/methenyltetrahydrofolate cyclohydrolase FolD [Candidatus Merdicola faecigallinarum]|uniref:Bifunctional protein FolD n=1 Tax=Candidatus Merdicola faecigallinarum TaxID=2840862 RepID=A0A9D1M1Z0_9FIRM|nr:bifunctional methylenetetrahydrofolate dehydrogenase/methenyltetrahydrofolate cyclohydrolase FolD [Candidatus Merdicola faecigallinarum]